MKKLFTTIRSQRVYLLLFLLTMGGIVPGKAQDKPATGDRVTNVRLTSVNQTSLEILYDLAVSNPGDSVYFEVTGRKSGSLSFSPGFIEGDFGRHVRAGPNRRIVWNVIANGYELNEAIRVRVLVKPGQPQSAGPISDSTKSPVRPDTAVLEKTARSYRPGGPLTALLSVLVPGLGNAFVQSPRPRIGLRPLLAVGVWGALAYGITQRSQSNAQYVLYAQQKNTSIAEPYFRQANQRHHRYYLATRAAAMVWLGDIGATMIRGLHNRSGRREASTVRLRPGYQSTTPVATLTLRF